ncbi:hypothetical protein FHS40_009164 [Streptomyces spectabilis]|uniref:Uncharacterized protein n=1 Tax=Streptomyces spectabilis TaxID=68270 RepID=A0A7W8B468_STRST|nr:hypothetical protein [Streptomyces spectabilis]
MPAPVRYRSTALVYAAGEADRGTTWARGARNAPPPPISITRSIAMPAPPFRHCRSKCVHLTLAAGMLRRRLR